MRGAPINWPKITIPKITVPKITVLKITVPKITVMVPTYNQAGFLGEAVASVLAQDYPNLDVVI